VTAECHEALVEFENRDARAISQPSSSGIVLVSMTMSPCSQRPKKLSRIQDYGSCPEALQILRGFRQIDVLFSDIVQIDLLFSDIVMPGKLNGIQLAAHRCEQLAANPFEKIIDAKAAEKLPY